MSEDAAAAAAAFLASATGGGSTGGGNKKKKKNKKKATATTDDPVENAAAPPEAPKDDDAARIMAELGIGTAETTTASTSDNKKKKKKKKKKDEPSEKQPSAAAKRVLAAKAQMEAAEAKRKAEEEALRLQEEEEERQRLEAERLEQERKDRKKQKEKEKKERLRAEGKAVTKAEKAREAKARQARERLIAQGLIEVDEDGNVVEKKKEKVSYSKKPNKKKLEEKRQQEEAKKAEELAAKKAAEEAAAAEAAKKAEEERKRKEEEEASATAVALAEAQKLKETQVLDDWDVSSDDDWDTAVLDKLSQIKSTLDADGEEVVDEEDLLGIKKPPTPKNQNNANTNTNTNKKGGKKKKQKKKQKRAAQKQQHQLQHNSDDDESNDEEPGAITGAERVRLKRLEREKEIEEARERREERLRAALKNRSKDELRSPICCVMGHVDTGKTKLLDKIRRTNVQDGEAGGITQQIGATFFSMGNLKRSTEKLNKDLSLEYKVPGLLVIDTPGHESFANLRKRGSSLCDIAILVIDLMHGLEAQTIESINMLRARKTPFIVALNKVDRLYSWKAHDGSPIRDSLKQQEEHVLSEFDTRTKQVITQLAEQRLNASLYYENDDYKRVVSLVPTSAHTGEGIPDLLLLLITLSQRLMTERLMFSAITEATVLDVKKLEGIGTTIDIVLVNGKLKKGDTIVVAGMNGPIVTQIRALLTPPEAREIRVKSEYIHHDELKAAIGIKIAAQGLEEAIAGTQMMVCTEEDDIDEICDAVQADVKDVMENVSTTGRGVCVQASTIGSLEALMEFLRVSNIPVAAVQIGPVHKKDVMRASIMLEHEKKYACILAFDVKVTREAQEYADDSGVRIFTADIIYHLEQHFMDYLKEVEEESRAEVEMEAVFPVILRVIPEHVFMKKAPLVFGVEVVDGICKIGTPIVVPEKLITDYDNPGEMKMLELGRITSIEKDGAATDLVKKGNAVCVKIEANSTAYVTFGRHFDHNNLLYSKLSRNSIDVLKANFKDDLQKTDWQLVIKMKSVFNIL